MKTKKSKHKKILIPVFILLAFVLAAMGVYLYADSLAYKVVHIQAGTVIQASDLIRKGDPEAVFLPEGDTILNDCPGTYNVVVSSKGVKHQVQVIVNDTIAPTADSVSVNTSMGTSVSADELICNINDATPVTITFDNEPDVSIPGMQDAVVRLVDAVGNASCITSKVNVLPFILEYSVEAGSESPTLADFKLGDYPVYCLTDLTTISMNSVGTSEVNFKYEGNEYSGVINVVDTTAPNVVFLDYSGYVGESITPQLFTGYTKDNTSLTYSFAAQPQCLEGEEEVEVIVTDEGGNSVSANCMLSLVKDTEPPTVVEVHDIQVYTGNSVSYQDGITISDNCIKDINIEVSHDNVDINTAGNYPITYTITDVGGNTVSVSSNVCVVERAYSMDEINARADEILAEIITPDMSDYDKCWEIFDYVRNHVMFRDKSDKDSYVKACYEGLIEGHGDCYVYACTSQTLLTRAGITNMMIERIPTRTTHYWNLVDYGEGWYHFDTTPRVPDHPTVFMWTEEQIQEYSAGHWRCYNYDHDVYPVTN